MQELLKSHIEDVTGKLNPLKFEESHDLENDSCESESIYDSLDETEEIDALLKEHGFSSPKRRRTTKK